MKLLNPAFRSGIRTRSAFTLVELLVTISIIAILSALLLQTAGYVQDKAARARAEAEIKTLESALEAYKLDFGTYPDGDGSNTSTKVLVDQLAIQPADNPQSNSSLKPLEIPLKMLSAYKPGTGQTYTDALHAGGCYLVDPYGNGYHYKFPGDGNRSGAAFFDLWSQGKKGDSNSNEATWIKNW